MDHRRHPLSPPPEDEHVPASPSGALQRPLEEPDREPGWKALNALHGIQSDALLAVMLRPSFKPVAEHDLVVISPCPHCQDGGLRTAGSVRTRTGREAVRACDTCCVVEIGPLGHANILRLPDTRRQP
jgi:hypothetical protein